MHSHVAVRSVQQAGKKGQRMSGISLLGQWLICKRLMWSSTKGSEIWGVRWSYFRMRWESYSIMNWQAFSNHSHVGARHPAWIMTTEAPLIHAELRSFLIVVARRIQTMTAREQSLQTYKSHANHCWATTLNLLQVGKPTIAWHQGFHRWRHQTPDSSWEWRLHWKMYFPTLLVADSFLSSTQPYTEAMKMLTDMYGQPDRIIIQQIRALVNGPDIQTGDKHAFLIFVLRVRSVVETWKQQHNRGRHELNSCSQVYLLVNKLPEDLQNSFNRFTEEQKITLPTLLHLAEWLNNEIRVQRCKVPIWWREKLSKNTATWWWHIAQNVNVLCN